MAERKMKRQPRAKTMLPAIKELITTKALVDRGKDRILLAHEIREEIKDKFPQEIAPTIETIIKKISAARCHSADPLDDVWHLGTLDRYPLLSEAIPYILKVKECMKKPNISIRQAIWVSRLYTSV
jgi:hypothetical protein